MAPYTLYNHSCPLAFYLSKYLFLIQSSLIYNPLSNPKFYNVLKIATKIKKKVYIYYLLNLQLLRHLDLHLSFSSVTLNHVFSFLICLLHLCSSENDTFNNIL